MIEPESEPFIKSAMIRDQKQEEPRKIYPEQRSRSLPTAKAVLVHMSLIILYTVLSLAYVGLQGWNHGEAQGIHVHQFATTVWLKQSAIIHLPIRKEPVAFSNTNRNSFAGPPSSEIDKSWHNLLGNISIRVYGNELERMNQTSVELPQKGEYMAWLGTYHELHCLVSI